LGCLITDMARSYRFIIDREERIARAKSDALRVWRALGEGAQS